MITAFSAGNAVDVSAWCPKVLGVRWHSCPHCGTELDLDYNASRNMFKRYQDQAGAGRVPQADAC